MGRGRNGEGGGGEGRDGEEGGGEGRDGRRMREDLPSPAPLCPNIILLRSREVDRECPFSLASSADEEGTFSEAKCFHWKPLSSGESCGGGEVSSAV